MPQVCPTAAIDESKLRSGHLPERLLRSPESTMGTLVTSLQPSSAVPTLIFLHIPKTGGSTLDAIIDANYPPASIFSVQSPIRDSLAAFRALPPAERERLRVIRGHGVQGVHRELERPCAYATLLRDPVDRVLSQYYFIRESPNHPRHRELLARGATLLEYLRAGLNPQADNGQVRSISGVGDGTADEIPFGTCTRAMLDDATRRLETEFALVGVTERFDEFLALAGRMLGWRHCQYVRRKVTRSRPLAVSLTPEERAAVGACTLLDRELYATARRRTAELCRCQGALFPLRVRWLKWQNSRQRPG
jgi:hypothetical protein